MGKDNEQEVNDVSRHILDKIQDDEFCDLSDCKEVIVKQMPLSKNAM